MKTRKYSLVSLLVALCLLAGALPLSRSIGAQVPPPNPAGPGRRLASAEPASPAEARRVLSRRSITAPRGIAALPASETEATAEIQALARALEHDPALIFDYVHNHVEYVPTFGSANGATATLLAGRGNDWDQTSLFIALMRAAGYSADYVVGDVSYSRDRLANWLGVEIGAVENVLADGGIPVTPVAGGYRLTRAWAQADIGGGTYVFDPAMKEYAETEGIDLAAATGYDRATFLARAQAGADVGADYVQNMNEANVRADLAAYSMNLVDEIQANMPDAALADVIGGRAIVQAEMGAYPTALPYAQDVTNETVYATVPDTYRHTLRLEHHGIDHTFYAFQIAGRRVTIFYDPADSYKPVLRVGGEEIAAGAATTQGARYDATLTVDHPYAADGGAYADQWATDSLESGSDYALAHDFGAASADLIASRNRLLTQYRHDGLADDSEAVRGEGLWLMGLNYCYEQYLYTRLLGQVTESVLTLHHTLGWMGQEAGYYITLSMEHLSVRQAATGYGSQPVHETFLLLTSALEHGILEQLQGSDREAVSTVKALQLSNAAGHKVFMADAGNWSTVKAQLVNYNAGELNLIEADINNGATVVLPEDGEIQRNEWCGMGYRSTIGGFVVAGYYCGSRGHTGDPGEAEFSHHHGGIVTWIAEIVADFLGFQLKENALPPDEKEEIKTPKSKDPVDMATGAFHYRRRDLTAGPDGLLDLRFERAYNSGDHDNLGPLGYGWSHNHQVSLARHSDYAPGMGRRQPTDASALITYAYAVHDLLANETGVASWMTADLATKWAMDQLLDNALTTHLSTTSLEFVRLPDGSYNPPPGIRQGLIQQGGYTYVQGTGNDVMVFDAEGRGRYWIDAHGNTLTYTYDGDGVLQSVGNVALGQTLAFGYTGDRLTSVTDQGGRSVTFAYTDDELTTFRDAENEPYAYAYDAAHRLTSVTRPRGNTVVTNVYDAPGRVETQTDGLGNTTTFYFSGYRSVEARPDGGRVIHFLDAQGRAVAREDAVGNRVQMTFDGQYHLRTLTDRLGDTSAFTYDPASGLVDSTTNNRGDTTTYTYAGRDLSFTNPLNADTVAFTFYNPEQVDYADGSSVSYTYDDHGNVETYTDQAGKTWTYEYNARGQVRVVTNPATGLTEYTYYPDGALKTSTDSDVGTTTYTYDGYLRLQRVTHPDATYFETAFNLNDQATILTDELGQAYTFAYDANGNLEHVTDPVGEVMTYTYDTMDQVTHLTDFRGKTTQTTYDEMNRLESVTDPNGHTITFGYDPRGWLNQITDPAGKVWTTAYDDEGMAVATTTPLGFTVAQAYDALGYTAAITDALGHTTAFSRDALSRITGERDPLGRLTDYAYDERGLLADVTLPDGRAATYEYDDLGLLETLYDLGEHTWGFGYTKNGRLQSETDPLGNAWTYTYDERGFMEDTSYPTGETETRTYDAAGNLTRRQYSGGLDLHYTYDDLNRLVATEGISLTYDEEGQVTNTQSPIPNIQFAASYDDGGRLETVSYADDLFTVTYTYDARDLLTGVTDSLTGATVEFVYDDDGRLTDVQRSNGVDTALSWDATARLTHIHDAGPSGTLIDLGLGYDDAGQIISQTYVLPLDPAGYLVTDTQDLQFDAASQIRSSGYAYDARGRLTADPERTYTWDGASRLVGVGQAGQDTTLSYNGLDDLLTRTATGQTTRYFYNYALGMTPIVAERDEGAGQFARFYVWTPDGRLLYMIDAANGNQVSFYHFDQVGSTLALTGEDGSLADAYAYDPYGRLLHHQGDSAQPFTFVGQWGVRQEGDSGTLYHMRARYYDAATTRFLSRDPVWPVLDDPESLNPYQYAYQKPLQYVDPSGLFSREDAKEYAWYVHQARISANKAKKYQEHARSWGAWISGTADQWADLAAWHAEQASGFRAAAAQKKGLEADIEADKDDFKAAWLGGEERARREQEEAEQHSVTMEEAEQHSVTIKQDDPLAALAATPLGDIVTSLAHGTIPVSGGQAPRQDGQRVTAIKGSEYGEVVFDNPFR